ncbi:MAG: carbonic anhydrase [Pyrinomonadaceae bacterium]
MDVSNVPADEALRRLIAGNESFVSGQVSFSGLPKESLLDLAAGQRPFATILGCSDSRVPPELIFAAGLGDLFVIRVAANVFSPEIAASLQYAGHHLGTRLFVVLGHEGCGAVSAALQTRDQNQLHRSRIQLLVEKILPALPRFDPQVSPEMRLAQAVEANVRWTLRQIVETPEGQARLAEGQLKLVGAIYEIESGRVRFLS